jgi:hypothetical protein
LNPGDYAFAFDFILPQNLPASLMVWLPSSHHRARAVVKYNIDATITNQDGSIVQFETMLLIQEPPVPFNPDIFVNQKIMAKSCCCANGEAQLETRFNKNVFFSNEQIHASIKIDMTTCKSALEKIRLVIV